MAGMQNKTGAPEREKTDESLSVERAKADHAMGEKVAEIEDRADAVVERARAEADQVLVDARAKADAKLKDPPSAEERPSILAHERAAEDRVLQDERAQADDLLQRRRAANRARLFPLERDKTDLFLLTERARSDDALANRDDFLGMVTHDLRDLLHGITMSAAVISAATDDARGTDSTRLGAERIQRSAGRMARLIGDLVDVASIDAGKLAVAPTVANAASVVVEAVETWGPAALAKGIVLESSVDEALVVEVDSARILQVLGNLITNAVKFSASGGKVLVAVERVGAEARFSVKDGGVGIPSDKLEAIFERFWQAGKNDRRGLGLGLYISKCLVDAHGGKIWAESVMGAGSTLSFTVPSCS